MILFASDWARYPEAIVHYKTSNVTFLRQAEVYKQMGIKNYAFILALHDPDLEDVDPHNLYLSIATRTKIILECTRNPWYFFREVVRIRPQGSLTPNKFRANRGNIALFWLFFLHIDSALIQPRQTGKSVSSDALMLYLLTVGSRNSRINLLTKDHDLRKANVERIKSMRNELPIYMQFRTTKDSDNQIEVDVKMQGNLYSTNVAQNSEAAALNVGRGTTAPVAVIDEPPFIPFIEMSIPAMLAAGTSARDEAADAGMPFGTIFTTTAGKKDTRSGRYMYDMIHGGMPWNEHLFDLRNQDQVTKVVRRRSSGQKPMVNITLSHKQLGYSDAWLAKKLAETNVKGEDADRDFFNRWTSGGLLSPLSSHMNTRIRNSEKDPSHVEVNTDGYTLFWYVPQDQIAYRMGRTKVIMGMDTSDAVGRDAISMKLIDSQNLEVLAAANVNDTNLNRFSDWIVELMVKYENLIMIPERRSSAATLIDKLLVQLPTKGIDPFKRIYNRVVDEHTTRDTDYKNIVQQDVHRRSFVFYDKYRADFGFATSGSGAHSRVGLYSVLSLAASLASDRCYDRILIDQITGLVCKNGRIDHGASGHDDSVIAWLLAIWMLSQSKNLRFYGIESPLSETVEYREGFDQVKPKTALDEFDQYQQKKIKDEMDVLLDKIKACRDELVSLQYEHKLKVLDSKLKVRYSENASLDVLINEARNQRQNKMRDTVSRFGSGSNRGYRI